jgi:hypothetical protein
MSSTTPQSPNDEPTPSEPAVTEPDESGSSDAPIAESAVADPHASDAPADNAGTAADAEEPLFQAPVDPAEETALPYGSSEPDTVLTDTPPAGTSATEREDAAPALPDEPVAVNAAEPANDVERTESAQPTAAAPTDLPVAAPVAGAAAAQAAEAAPTGAPAPVWSSDPAATQIQTVAPVTPVYVAAPTQPKRKGNRGAGILIALLATVAYAIVSAIVVLVIFIITKRTVDTAVHDFVQYIGTASYFIPIIFFALAFFLLVAIVNRGGWWAYVIGAFFVAVVVYFAYIGGVLLTIQAWQFSPAEVGRILNQLWANPLTIGAAVVAREVPIWFGAWIAARGRKVRERNAEAQREYEREVAAGPNLLQRTA